jgi:hypothetical protein
MAIEKSLASTSLAEVVDRILEKGVVVDAYVRVSLVGIELLAIEVRAIVASVETWLKYAEAIGLTTDPRAACGRRRGQGRRARRRSATGCGRARHLDPSLH